MLRSLGEVKKWLIRSKWVVDGIMVLLCLGVSLWFKGSSIRSLSSDSNVATSIIPVEIPSAASKANAPSSVQPNTTLSSWLPSIPKHPGLASSSNPQLKSLAQLEQTYGGGVTNRIMTFTDTPTTIKQAQNDASGMAATLKDFSSNGISPLVIMEPTTSSGNSINFQNYRNGAYDSIMSAYYQTLKNQGINDAMMGMWVYFPEANLPEWGPVDQVDFAANVVRTIKMQKQYFPSSKSSIMLDAESYPAGSADWGSGSYASLAPFINGIPDGLIDSFGLQGFPWVPPANEVNSASLSPSIFLNSSLASSAASQLGTSNIWLNTGTFAAMYTNNSNQTVTMSASQRASILNGVFQQANNLKKSGFTVAVNLFSENKSAVAEATDWSYQTSDAQAVFADFASELQSHGIGLWLFT